MEQMVMEDSKVYGTKMITGRKYSMSHLSNNGGLTTVLNLGVQYSLRVNSLKSLTKR